MSLSAAERRAVDEIEQRADDLVALAADLVRFDTTAREPGASARDEAALQEYLAARLSAVGAEVDLWEPSPSDVAGTRLTPPDVDFEGRPQLAARFAGSAGGRSLLLNGHVDVVSGEPRERWTSDPNQPEVRDGRLYGRGSYDMKGGVASMTFAAEVLALSAFASAATSSSARSRTRSPPASAGWLPSPTAFAPTRESSRSLRGSTPGSPAGAASCRRSPFRAGRATPGSASRTGARAAPSTRSRRRSSSSPRSASSRTTGARARITTTPHLSPGDIVPTVIQGGEWMVSYPSSCRIVFHVAYLPVHAHVDGWGTAVEREIVERVERVARADPWLAENPPVIEWAPEVPSAEVAPDHPVVEAVLGAAPDVGRPGRVTGMDSWHDGATFTRFGGTPSICFGPGALETAHTIDESVPVEDLVHCAQALAVAALRFCGPG